MVIPLLSMDSTWWCLILMLSMKSPWASTTGTPGKYYTQVLLTCLSTCPLTCLSTCLYQDEGSGVGVVGCRMFGQRRTWDHPIGIRQLQNCKHTHIQTGSRTSDTNCSCCFHRLSNRLLCCRCVQSRCVLRSWWNILRMKMTTLTFWYDGLTFSELCQLKL